MGDLFLGRKQSARLTIGMQPTARLRVEVADSERPYDHDAEYSYYTASGYCSLMAIE